MPINASPHFERAQAEYEQAQTTERKILLLKKIHTISIVLLLPVMGIS